MSRYTHTTLSGDAASKTSINAMGAAIETGQAGLLSRSGEAPNAMEAHLDMNNNDLQNVGNVSCDALSIGGSNIVATGASTVVWPYFSAHKNGTDQVIGSGATTKVEWLLDIADAAEFDSGTGVGKWTPGQNGFVNFTANLFVSDWVDGKSGSISVYKDGALWRFARSSRAGTGEQNFQISLNDLCGDTTYYEIYFWHDTGTNRTIKGTTTHSFWAGSIVSSQSGS